MTASGVVIRTPVSEFRIIGRGTKGVRVMRLDENDRVVGIAFLKQVPDPGQENGVTDADNTPASP
jgi:DNA gyrase subunit A